MAAKDTDSKLIATCAAYSAACAARRQLDPQRAAPAELAEAHVACCAAFSCVMAAPEPTTAAGRAAKARAIVAAIGAPARGPGGEPGELSATHPDISLIAAEARLVAACRRMRRLERARQDITAELRTKRSWERAMDDRIDAFVGVARAARAVTPAGALARARAFDRARELVADFELDAEIMGYLGAMMAADVRQMLSPSVP